MAKYWIGFDESVIGRSGLYNNTSHNVHLNCSYRFVVIFDYNHRIIESTPWAQTVVQDASGFKIVHGTRKPCKWESVNATRCDHRISFCKRRRILYRLRQSRRIVLVVIFIFFLKSVSTRASFSPISPFFLFGTIVQVPIHYCFQIGFVQVIFQSFEKRSRSFELWIIREKGHCTWE